MDLEALTDPGRLYTVAVELGVRFGTGLVTAIIVLLVGLWLARRISNALVRVMEKASLEPTLVRFLGNIAYALLVALVVLAAISQMGVQTASFIAMLGAAAFAIGLALQGSLSNLASGILLMIFRPYRIGDFIEAGGVAGSVLEVQIFSTMLKTPDNKMVIVPNSSVMAGPITNYSAMPTRRVDLVASVSYDDDLKKVRRVLESVLAAESRILEEPAPNIAVNAMAASSIDFIIRPWVNTSDYWPVFWDLQEAIKNAFDENGISIPYPQTDIHIHQSAAATKDQAGTVVD